MCRRETGSYKSCLSCKKMAENLPSISIYLKFQYIYYFIYFVYYTHCYRPYEPFREKTCPRTYRNLPLWANSADN